jgi:hypothetical protein
VVEWILCVGNGSSWVLFIIPLCKHVDTPNFQSISNLGLISFLYFDLNPPKFGGTKIRSLDSVTLVQQMAEESTAGSELALPRTEYHRRSKNRVPDVTNLERFAKVRGKRPTRDNNNGVSVRLGDTASRGGLWNRIN